MITARIALTIVGSLLGSTSHAHALQLIERVRQDCSFIALQSGGGPYLEGLSTYLDYMLKTWMPIELWAGWSRFGRDKAAVRLGIALEGVIPTTNHLESLNGALKRKYIPQWQHSGHRLRFDVLIYHLVSGILPQIYAQQRMITDYAAWKAQRFEITAGDPDELLNTHREGAFLGLQARARASPRYAFYTSDTRRDADAQGILASGKLHPVSSARPHEQWAYCISVSDSSTRYWLTAHPSGSATCTCPDWLHRGGACKHMRAFRLLIESWMQHGHLLPNSFHFPASASEAAIVEARNRAWYGEWFERSVTTLGQPKSVDGLGGKSTAGTNLEPSTAAVVPSRAVDSTASGPLYSDEAIRVPLPEHLQSARSSLRHIDEVPQLLPPTHPLLSNMLEAEVKRASDIMELTGDLGVVEVDRIGEMHVDEGSQVCSSRTALQRTPHGSIMRLVAV